jgi:hypothetical protein
MEKIEGAKSFEKKSVWTRIKYDARNRAGLFQPNRVRVLKRKVRSERTNALRTRTRQLETGPRRRGTMMLKPSRTTRTEERTREKERERERGSKR